MSTIPDSMHGQHGFIVQSSNEPVIVLNGASTVQASRTAVQTPAYRRQSPATGAAMSTIPDSIRDTP
ncbi:hypothetical protein SAMN02745244_00910 [Tessaracoccus bendigoensis DSM 12906]|uniref:Uncharacterized protein n=1 Tax=Tessaracoccus bendigoensis DSM 12906 TaxID=1123357 RepID=A0A1M6DEM8_9ACTN|nr:hypothetical protein SAMN02745244_00910 [Tessaracoccus bendigoensis DSM 12906]